MIIPLDCSEFLAPFSFQVYRSLAQIIFQFCTRTHLHFSSRFEGTDTGLRRKYQLRKRMAKAIGLDREAAVKAAEMAEMGREMEMAVEADKNAMQGEPSSEA